MRLISGFFSAILFTALLPCSASAQTGFEEFKKANAETLGIMSSEFDTYKDGLNREFSEFNRRKQLEFAEFLKRKWNEFGTLPGRGRPLMPDPAAPPALAPGQKTPAGEFPVLPEPVEPPQSGAQYEPRTPVPQKGARYVTVDIEFLGLPLKFTYDSRMRMKLGEFSEERVGDFWKNMAMSSYDELVYQCGIVRKAMSVSDWGIYLLIRKLAENVFPAADYNERIVFSAFMLDAYGIASRIGFDPSENKLILFVAIEEEVYDIPYSEYGGNNFYALDYLYLLNRYLSYDPAGRKDDKRRMVMTMPSAMKPGPGTRERTVECRLLTEPLKLKYNINSLAYYDTMPLSNPSVYFNSECPAEAANSLTEALAPYMENKGEHDKCRFLLGFMHDAFPYMTDEEQFGREKYMFCEELLAYPYSDCEDRSVLFAFLVRRLTGLSVVGVMYNDHMAAAVKFTEDPGGAYIVVDGAKYTICDPTYIGASIGDCMPDYRSVPARVIKVR